MSSDNEHCANCRHPEHKTQCQFDVYDETGDNEIFICGCLGLDDVKCGKCGGYKKYKFKAKKCRCSSDNIDSAKSNHSPLVRSDRSEVIQDAVITPNRDDESSDSPTSHNQGYTKDEVEK
jgi:hypothetical protein